MYFFFKASLPASSSPRSYVAYRPSGFTIFALGLSFQRGPRLINGRGLPLCTSLAALSGSRRYTSASGRMSSGMWMFCCAGSITIT